MGMTIDTTIQWLEILRANLKTFPEISKSKKIEALDTAISYLEDYQQMQSYMLAMLTEIQLEIKKFAYKDKDIAVDDCLEIIQDKINALKENEVEP
jgi:2-phosphoglycerate kinase